MQTYLYLQKGRITVRQTYIKTASQTDYQTERHIAKRAEKHEVEQIST